jgi:archaellum biogenesis ATPase FlaH
MWNKLVQLWRQMFRTVSSDASHQDVAWLEREEAQQMQEVRERLERIREQLIIIDQTKTHRY